MHTRQPIRPKGKTWLKVAGVSCDRCGAQPGEPCLTSTGNLYDDGYHAHVSRFRRWRAEGRPTLYRFCAQSPDESCKWDESWSCTHCGCHADEDF